MIQTNRDQLISALERCAKVTPSKSTLPILTHALFSAGNGRFSYTSSDLQLSLSGSIEATGEGRFLASPKELLSAVQALSGETVKLAHDKSTLTVSAEGKRKFKISTLHGDEFPKVNEMPVAGMALPDNFREALSRALYAARNDGGEDQLAQRTVRVTIKDGSASFDATDGHRLAHYVTTADGETEFMLPVSAARSVLATDGPLTFAHVNGELFFRSGDDVLGVRSYDAIFPPVEHMLNYSLSQRLKVDAVTLAEAVSAVSRVGESVTLKLNPSSIRIEAFDSGKGAESSDEIPAECTKELSISFQSRYLNEALKGLTGEILAEYGNDLEPLRFKLGDMTGLLMPVRP